MTLSHHPRQRFLRIIRMGVFLFLFLAFVATVYQYARSKRYHDSWKSGLDNPASPPPMPAGFRSLWQIKASLALGSLPLVNLKAPLPAGVKVEEDIVYATVGSTALKLDLYSSENTATSPRPLVIFIHGGGWRAGAKDMYRFYAANFARHGYVAISTNYRKSPGAVFPAALEDVWSVVRWARAHASSHAIATSAVALVGGSAGGHLAMLAGFLGEKGLPAVNGRPAIPGESVQAVVDLYGPTDLTIEGLRDLEIVRDFLGTSYASAPELFRVASPRTWVASAVPPTLVIHGTLDDVVPFEQAQALTAALASAGARFAFEPFPGWPHAMDAAVVVNQRCEYLMGRFLADHLTP